MGENEEFNHRVAQSFTEGEEECGQRLCATLCPLWLKKNFLGR